MKPNQAAFDAGQLAQRLTGGYFAHLTAITIVADPRADALAPQAGIVKNKNGTEHSFSFPYYLQLARTDTLITSELERIWFTGSLLRMGDVLAQNGYFDRAPELELLRHLRNGVAHGNRFRIDDAAKLQKWPAHNRDAFTTKVNKGSQVFEVTENLDGQTVLFDFMAAGDVLCLLQSVAEYLITLGTGEQPAYWQRAEWLALHHAKR